MCSLRFCLSKSFHACRSYIHKTHKCKQKAGALPKIRLRFYTWYFCQWINAHRVCHQKAEAFHCYIRRHNYPKLFLFLLRIQKTHKQVFPNCGFLLSILRIHVLFSLMLQPEGKPLWVYCCFIRKQVRSGHTPSSQSRTVPPRKGASLSEPGYFHWDCPPGR